MYECMYVCMYIYIYIYIYTYTHTYVYKILHAKIPWATFPGELPFGRGISPLEDKVLTESNP